MEKEAELLLLVATVWCGKVVLLVCWVQAFSPQWGNNPFARCFSRESKTRMLTLSFGVIWLSGALDNFNLCVTPRLFAKAAGPRIYYATLSLQLAATRIL